jgi:maleylacetoacetate isomerase
MSTLYHYWRSSSSWRVRWALKFKQQDVNYVHVSLLNGESESSEHLKRNALGYVPVLEINGHYLIESVAILEWLEEKYPERPLLPIDLIARSHVRALCQVINSDTQPVQNLTVLDRYSADEAKRKEWSQFFIRRGLSAFEKICAPQAGKFSFGDQVTMADLFLVPQLYNAQRFEVDLNEFPLLKKIYDSAMLLPDAVASSPESFQPPAK